MANRGTGLEQEALDNLKAGEEKIEHARNMNLNTFEDFRRVNESLYYEVEDVRTHPTLLSELRKTHNRLRAWSSARRRRPSTTNSSASIKSSTFSQPSATRSSFDGKEPRFRSMTATCGR